MRETDLIDMARQRLWFACYSIDNRGEVTFDIEGVDLLLAENCRLGAKSKTSGFAPFALCADPAEAHRACDTLLAAMRKNAASHGRRGPRTLEDKLARLWSRELRRQQQREPAPAGP
jgi:hypothetical protein